MHPVWLDVLFRVLYVKQRAWWVYRTTQVLVESVFPTFLPLWYGGLFQGTIMQQSLAICCRLKEFVLLAAFSDDYLLRHV